MTQGTAAMKKPLVEAGALEQLAAIQLRFQQGEESPALQALDDLRSRYPDNDEIGLYWFDMALRLKRIELACGYARLMQARAGSEVGRARWMSALGRASMLCADFVEAVRIYSQVLDALCGLAIAGEVPAPAQSRPASLDGVGVAHAEKRLGQVLSSLKAAGEQVFPMYGTLLGWVREGALLPFDKDLDLGVWLEDFRSTCRHLLDAGMKVAPLTPPYDNYVSFTDPQSGLTFDVCGLRREPERQQVVGGFWLYGKTPDHQRVSILPWFELLARQRPEGEIWWPGEPESILAAMYGDWRTPRPEWDSVISALNVQPGSLQQRCYAYARLASRWLAGDIPKTRRYLDQVAFCLPGDALVDRCRSALDQVLVWLKKK